MNIGDILILKMFLVNMTIIKKGYVPNKTILTLENSI